mgnify:FL=1
MARKFLVSVDLNKNELQNARVQNLGAAPSSPVTGQIYYDTSNNTMYYYNGLTSPDGPWMPMSGSTEVIQDVIGSTIVGGTGITATYGDPAGTETISITNTGVTAGSYGSTTQIPTFTVNAQGQLTAAGTVNVATVLSIAGDTGTDTVNLLSDVLTFVGTDPIDTTITNNTVTISAKDASTTIKGVASFDSTDFSVTAGNVTLNKDPVITLTGDVAGSGTMTNLGSVTITTTVQPDSVALGTDTTGSYVSTIAGTANQITVTGSGSETAAVTLSLPNDVTINNNLTVGGDLNVTGKVNSINTNIINIQDNKINLNSAFTGAPVADAGMLVERGTSADVEILWNETNDNWTLTNDGTNYHAIARKYVQTLATSATSYVVTHNLATQDVMVQVSETASPYAKVETDMELTSANTITLRFATAPAAGAYKVVVIG